MCSSVGSRSVTAVDAPAGPCHDACGSGSGSGSGRILATAAAVALLALGSASRAAAFTPPCGSRAGELAVRPGPHRRQRFRPRGSIPGRPAVPAGSNSPRALFSTLGTPPPVHALTADPDLAWPDLEQPLAEARADLAARSDEVAAIIEAQSLSLGQISALAADLAAREGSDLPLAERQDGLSVGLEQVAQLVAEASEAGLAIRKAEARRVEALALVEQMEGLMADAAAELDAAADFAAERDADSESTGSGRGMAPTAIGEAAADSVVEAAAKAIVTELEASSLAEAAKEASDDEEEEFVVGDRDPVASEREAQAHVAELTDWKLDGWCATGRVFNHDFISDGDVIVTSQLTDPSSAREGAVVTTESGSQYMLGAPYLADFGDSAGSEEFMHDPTDDPIDAEIDPIDAEVDVSRANPTIDLGQAKSKLELTGEAVGDGRYLLAGTPIVSKHGRSEIWSTYRANSFGLPKGEPLCVKLSPHAEAMDREDRNYRAVTSGIGNRSRFVKRFEYINAESSYGNKAALIMERGTEDLKGFIEQVGALEGSLIRDAVTSAILCVEAVHSADLVWTDLKAENFVVIERGDSVDFRGIDLESAMPRKDNPVDYSPEACPPEFAVAFLEDGGQNFILEPSYDIWSLGTLIYELATGKALFEGMDPLDITQALVEYQPGQDVLAEISDPKLSDLVQQCLQKDPSARPKVAELLQHPYLARFNIGFGSFGW